MRFLSTTPHKISIVDSVPPPDSNAPKNVTKWLNKQKPFDRATLAGQMADFI